jgi:general secretion pathway protein F
MPVFDYTALDKKGKNISGIIEAEGAVAARQKLRSSGNYPISINEVKGAVAAQKEKPSLSFNIFARVKQSEIVLMTRQLATLVGAGFPLVSAMDTLLPLTKSQGFTKVIAQIKDSIVEGNSFAQALSQYPGTFSQLYINMVHSGESSGTLEIVLERLADILEKQQALMARIRSAMYYPVFMCLFGVTVLFLLLTVILPNITSIFDDMNKALPAPTEMLISLSAFMRAYWWVFLLLLILFSVAFRYIKRTEKGRLFIDKSILSLPLMGELAKKLSVGRFSRTLGSLLDNGVPMLNALEIVKNIAGNVRIAMIIENAAQEVEKGGGLGESLASADVFPQLAVQMIQVGEQSGNLEEMLTKVADVFENEVETNIMSMTSLLEPLMILTMGIVLGFIVLSVCLPIFDMNTLVM